MKKFVCGGLLVLALGAAAPVHADDNPRTFEKVTIYVNEWPCDGTLVLIGHPAKVPRYFCSK